MLRRSAVSFRACLAAGARSASTVRSRGIIKANGVKSVSKWTWDFCEQFTELVPEPTLSLPTGKPLVPAAEVFAELDIDDNLLLDPPKTKYIFEHCNIEQVMRRLGFTTTNPYYYNILRRNEAMVEHLATARREEKADTRHEDTIDHCARAFLALCGFDDRPFSIAGRGDDFKIFGTTCHSKGDHYVVVSPNNDLVLVCEDKSLKERRALAKDGHLGQIVGELLQLLSLNRGRRQFRSVFAVRVVNFHVTAFRISAPKATLRTLCDSRDVPKKLQLLCTEADPTTGRGLSLIDKSQRLQALQRMADIKQFILNEKL